MSTTAHRFLVAWSALAALVPACAFNSHGDGNETGEGGATSTTSSSSTGTGGEVTFCTPGSLNSCYSGPGTTQGKGICKAGTRVCNADGTGYGPCQGEVLPQPVDNCMTPLDENCDGTPNETCPCDPGEVQACYTGPAGTENVGLCLGGVQTCNANGMGFGSCMGEVTPQTEDCTTPLDEDCDGKVFDDADSGCVCDPTMMPAPCYTGPSGTENVGVCHGGTESCNPDGKSLTGCQGEVTPTPENCATGTIDEDCNGFTFDDTNALCVCDPAGMPASCSTGMMGVCAAGTQTCNADGKGYGNCTPITPASTEDCSTTTIADENCDGDNTCNGGSLVGKTKGTASKEDIAFGVAFDQSGNFFAGGIIDGAFAPLFSAGSLWLAKYTPTGGVAWEKIFAPTGVGAYAVVYGVATDAAGNVFAGGEFKGALVVGGTNLLSDTSGGGVDAFLMKLDAGGNVLWVRGFGSTSAKSIASVAVDTGGNVLICGGMAGSANFGGGALTANGLSTDAFAAKLDTNGGHVWSKIAGDAGFQTAWGVAAAPNGDAVVVGEFTNHLNFGSDQDAGNDRDVFVVRLLGSDGSQVWVKAFGDNSDQAAYGVAVDAQGNPVVTGKFVGNINFGGGGNLTGTNNTTSDVFVVKLKANDGANIWAKGFGTAGDQTGNRVALDGLGNVVVTGFFKATINFGGTDLVNMTATSNDIFLAKLSGGNGAHIWSKAFGDAADQQGLDVAVDNLGNIVVGGGFQGMADFGMPVGTLTSTGGYDIFAVKLKP